MNIDQASTFLVGSILVMVGLIVIVSGVVFINNIIAKYWKPMKLTYFESMPPRFASMEEIQKVEPSTK
jgi:hypothetical protein